MSYLLFYKFKITYLSGVDRRTEGDDFWKEEPEFLCRGISLSLGDHQAVAIGHVFLVGELVHFHHHLVLMHEVLDTTEKMTANNCTYIFADDVIITLQI